MPNRFFFLIRHGFWYGGEGEEWVKEAMQMIGKVSQAP